MKQTKETSHSVFLRVPSDLYQQLLSEALRASARLGKPVSVQTVVIDRLRQQPGGLEQGAKQDG